MQSKRVTHCHRAIRWNVQDLKAYPVTGGELDTARVLLNDLLHLLPCSCQSDLRENESTFTVLLPCRKRIRMHTGYRYIIVSSSRQSVAPLCLCLALRLYRVGAFLTMLVSSRSCLKCSFFFLASASTCSLNSFSFSSLSSRDADSQRWSFLRLRRVSDHVASEERTWGVSAYSL